jgi:hypothetical protein
MPDLANGGPAVLRAPILPQGQYGFLNDLRRVADGTPAGVGTLARKAGLRGILAKYNDGPATVARDGSDITWQANFRALAGPCRQAGLMLMPWGYVYPPDRTAVGELVAEALADSGQATYILDAEIEFDQAPNGAADAQALIAAVRQAAPGVRLGYTSWGWPDQHPAFPWRAFQEGCDFFLPQVYPALLRVGPDYAWLRAYGGHDLAGGANPGNGPQGFASLAPTKPVVPILDLSAIATEAHLVRKWAGPAIAWWVLDGITTGKAGELGGTPYAGLAPGPVPPKPTSLPSHQPGDVTWQERALTAEAKIAAALRILQGE